MIEIKNLNYSIKGKQVLENINLTINDGEFAAILGPNGAGKTTLLKIILNLIKDYQGSILVDGTNIKTRPEKRIIGYLPQNETFDIDFPATARDITLMGYAGIKGLFKRFSDTDRNIADNCLRKVGLSGKESQYIGSLSGGEFQRVLLSRALISDSKYLFLDEPEASLDKQGVAGFFELLRQLNKTGKTILVVSHDINILTKYCSLLICLNRTLHFHDKAELFNSEIITNMYGEATRILEKDY